MLQQVEAVYEDGLLRPLTPVDLDEKQCLQLIIGGATPNKDSDAAIVEWARSEVAAMTDVPTIEEVRKLLSTIPGSISDAVTAERGTF